MKITACGAYTATHGLNKEKEYIYEIPFIYSRLQGRS